MEAAHMTVRLTVGGGQGLTEADRRPSLIQVHPMEAAHMRVQPYQAVPHSQMSSPHMSASLIWVHLT